MAGTDNTLLALVGAGFPQRRSFGFASCERVVGAAEGMNVLAAEQQLVVPQQGQQQQQHAALAAAAPAPAVQRRYSYRVTNVEYTEFERLGVADASVDAESNTSVFPANTNVLYVGLQVQTAPPAASCSCRCNVVVRCRSRCLPDVVCTAMTRTACCLHMSPSPPLTLFSLLPRLFPFTGGGACGAFQHGGRFHRCGAARHDSQPRKGGVTQGPAARRRRAQPGGRQTGVHDAGQWGPAGQCVACGRQQA